jgi:hypothetical protein
MERLIQQHLAMTTQGTTWLRSEAVGWNAEDPSRFVPGGGHDNIGRSPGYPAHYTYSTPLAALADGWRLLAPPEKFTERGHELMFWWFVREVVTDVPAPGVA